MVFQPMTWKATAFLSSATVFAIWIASGPPPKPAPTAPSLGAGVVESRIAEPTDIVVQADRLHARLHPSPAYIAPLRDPFRFSPSKESTETAAAETSEALAQPSEQVQALGFSLSGIAEERAGGVIVRTAVVSVAGGIALVKEGDMIADQYLVTRIANDSVELSRMIDGAFRRLGFGP
jgi:hypothetical protein